MAGISYCDETYRITRRNSPIYVFEYILEGEGTVITDGKRFKAKKGDVYILHRQSNHEYFCDRTDPWTKIWFNAKGHLIDSLIQIYKLNQTNHIYNADVSRLFFELLDKARQAKISNSSFIKDASLIFHELVLSLYPYVHKNPEAFSKEAGVLKEYLDQNNKNKFGLKELSEQIYHSPSQTIRIFKKAFGITPYQYLMNQKIELAKLLLLNTNKSIKEIAAELNFCDEHYFSNYFTQRIGLAPLKFRKLNQ
jgi:AraC-like DNA-binding protein